MERQRHGEPPDYADLLLRGGSNLAATIYEPLSTAHLKSCTVDFDSRPDKKAVNLVQYDQTIPVLCVSLKKGGTEYKVPSDADVNIRMDKRDGYHVYNPALGVNAERTIAYFAVTPQMSTGWGDYYPIVEITVGGGVAGSAPIWLHFDRNPLPENAIISSDEYKTIQQLLEDVKAVKADTEAIKTATEQIKAQTEAVRDQAKGFADNAKNSADKAQTLVDGMPSDYSQAMKDIGTLKNQMQRAYPDDSTIGENPWSSKNIVDMLCPPLEESSNPVVCYPVAGYPLGVKAKWEPMQEGTGTPSPENIRPIKGRDSVRVERCGENLLAIKPFNKHTSKGITYEYVPDGGIHVSGTALTSVDSPTFPVWLLPPGKYFGLELSSEISASIVVQRNGKNLWLNAKGAFEILAGDVTKYWYAIVSADATVDKTVYPYIVSGTTAPTTYTPYIGQTNTLTLPETVYGGEVDAVTGDAKGTWQVKSLDGTEGWAIRDTYIGVYNLLSPTDSGKAICTHFDVRRTFNGDNLYISDTGTVYLGRALSNKYTVDTWCAYLAAQNDAGTPVQVAYKLAEPVPFTATGAQPLSALAGANTVLTDADSATVTGRADPIKRIADLEAAVASIN
jgi:hypothetical protein